MYGRTRFDTVHVVDRERRRDWHRVFEKDLEATRIVAELEVLLNSRIRPGGDLLFFDEIQACPRALVPGEPSTVLFLATNRCSLLCGELILSRFET